MSVFAPAYTETIRFCITRPDAAAPWGFQHDPPSSPPGEGHPAGAFRGCTSSWPFQLLMVAMVTIFILIVDVSAPNRAILVRSHSCYPFCSGWQKTALRGCWDEFVLRQYRDNATGVGYPTMLQGPGKAAGSAGRRYRTLLCRGFSSNCNAGLAQPPDADGGCWRYRSVPSCRSLGDFPMYERRAGALARRLPQRLTRRVYSIMSPGFRPAAAVDRSRIHLRKFWQMLPSSHRRPQQHIYASLISIFSPALRFLTVCTSS